MKQFLKQIRQNVADLVAAEKELRDSKTDIENVRKSVLSVSSGLPKDLVKSHTKDVNLKKEKWLKRAKSETSDKQVLAALSVVESKQNRKSCEAALGILTRKKACPDIAAEIKKALDHDAKVGAELVKLSNDISKIADDLAKSNDQMKTLSTKLKASEVKTKKGVDALGKAISKLEKAATP